MCTTRATITRRLLEVVGILHEYISNKLRSKLSRHLGLGFKGWNYVFAFGITLLLGYWYGKICIKTAAMWFLTWYPRRMRHLLHITLYAWVAQKHALCLLLFAYMDQSVVDHQRIMILNSLVLQSCFCCVELMLSHRGLITLKVYMKMSKYRSTQA